MIQLLTMMACDPPTESDGDAGTSEQTTVYRVRVGLGTKGEPLGIDKPERLLEALEQAVQTTVPDHILPQHGGGWPGPAEASAVGIGTTKEEATNNAVARLSEALDHRKAELVQRIMVEDEVYPEDISDLHALSRGSSWTAADAQILEEHQLTPPLQVIVPPGPGECGIRGFSLPADPKAADQWLGQTCQLLDALGRTAALSAVAKAPEEHQVTMLDQAEGILRRCMADCLLTIEVLASK